jgi:serine/threonine protein kinase
MESSWIGRSLNNRYKINALLGKGGMSSVYKALDPNLKRTVAIKLIHPHLSAEEDFIHRFKKEAAAVAAFRHPNIIQVYDFNVDNDVYYMVLEFIPGETLQERLKELKRSDHKMPIAQAIGIMLNVCDALGYAHKGGMIHRDIKPANIMLNVYGQAILMDFGIVKILDDTSHTATDAVVGTARYMSPEVIRAETPDERSDIYSLGVTFYETLSGEPPFNANSAMSLLMKHLNDPVPDLRKIREDTPPELVRIIKKMLEKERDKRYRNTDELTADLKRLISTLETVPIPPIDSTPELDATAVDDKTVLDPPPGKYMPEELTQFEAQSEALRPSPPPREEKPTIQMHPAKPSVEIGINTGTGISKTGVIQTPPTRKSAMPLLMLGGAGVFLIIALIVVAGGWYLFRNLSASPEPTNTPEPTATIPAAAAVAVEATATWEPTPQPTATYPPLYVRINNIWVNDSNYYVVEYETFGYTESLPGQHVHFFFNTVSPEQAGMPGSGPWELYGGPRPFTKYSVSSKPQNATQMCALVANSNHTIILESGNCFYLP